MKSLSLLSLAILSTGSINILTTIAQTNPETPPETPQTNPTPTLPLPLLQAAPLVKATSKLLGQQRYQIESEIELTLNLPDAPLLSNAQISTTVTAPNKVQAEITLVAENGKSDQKYQVVSNGIKVWIYDQQQNQYSVSEYKQFIKSQSGLAVGILSNFYLKTLHGVNNSTIASRTMAQLPPDRLLRYFQRFTNIDLQNIVIRTEQLSAQTYNVYDINAADQSYQITTYVNPLSADIERIDLAGKKDDLEITVTEQIIKQSIPATIAVDVFNFVPPEDAEQVTEQIAIAPFLD